MSKYPNLEWLHRQLQADPDFTKKYFDVIGGDEHEKELLLMIDNYDCPEMLKNIDKCNEIANRVFGRMMYSPDSEHYVGDPRVKYYYELGRAVASARDRLNALNIRKYGEPALGYEMHYQMTISHGSLYAEVKFKGPERIADIAARLDADLRKMEDIQDRR